VNRAKTLRPPAGGYEWMVARRRRKVQITVRQEYNRQRNAAAREASEAQFAEVTRRLEAAAVELQSKLASGEITPTKAQAALIDSLPDAEVNLSGTLHDLNMPHNILTGECPPNCPANEAEAQTGRCKCGRSLAKNDSGTCCVSCKRGFDTRRGYLHTVYCDQRARHESDRA